MSETEQIEQMQQQLQTLQDLLNKQQADMAAAALTRQTNTMVTTVKGPPCLEKVTSFDSYAKQIRMWTQTCGLPKKSWGARIADSLTDTAPLRRGLRTRFFDLCDEDKMRTDDGYDEVMDFLKKELQEPKLYGKLRAYHEFAGFKRQKQQKPEEYVQEFDSRYLKCKAVGLYREVDWDVFAFEMLERANITQEKRQLIITQCVAAKVEGEDLYKAMGEFIKSIAGEGPPTAESSHDSTGMDDSLQDLKLEPADTNVFLTTEGKKVKLVPVKRKGKQKKEAEKSKEESKEGEQKKNKAGPDGKINRCYKCQSEYHYANVCPNNAAYKAFIVQCGNNIPQSDGHVSSGSTGSSIGLDEGEDNDDTNSGSNTEVKEEERDVVCFSTILATANKIEEISELTRETKGGGVLDTACMKNVAGKHFVEDMKKLLSSADRKKVKKIGESNRNFRFGNEGVLKSQGLYSIPVHVAGKEYNIEFDVVDSDIPLLISKEEMKKHGVMINTADDTVMWDGAKAEVIPTSSGNICISLVSTAPCCPVLNVQTDFKEAETKEKRLELLKRIHVQFGHIGTDKVVGILKDAEVFEDGDRVILNKLRKGCKGCILRRRADSIPKVSAPSVSDFNEKVCIDLKIFGGGKAMEGGTKAPEQTRAEGNILHLTDAYTRYHQSVYVENKTCEAIVDEIMTK